MQPRRTRQISLFPLKSGEIGSGGESGFLFPKDGEPVWWEQGNGKNGGCFGSPCSVAIKGFTGATLCPKARRLAFGEGVTCCCATTVNGNWAKTEETEWGKGRQMRVH